MIGHKTRHKMHNSIQCLLSSESLITFADMTLWWSEWLGPWTRDWLGPVLGCEPLDDWSPLVPGPQVTECLHKSFRLIIQIHQAFYGPSYLGCTPLDNCTHLYCHHHIVVVLDSLGITIYAVIPSSWVNLQYAHFYIRTEQVLQMNLNVETAPCVFIFHFCLNVILIITFDYLILYQNCVAHDSIIIFCPSFLSQPWK